VEGDYNDQGTKKVNFFDYVGSGKGVLIQKLRGVVGAFWYIVDWGGRTGGGPHFCF